MGKVPTTHALGFIGILLATTTACGDDTTSSTDPATTSSTSTGTGGTGGNGTGGSAGGTGGTGGSGGSGCTQPPTTGVPATVKNINGCDGTDLTDSRGEATVTIGSGFENGEFLYTPKCVLVSPCTNITIEITDGQDFLFHPLVPGTAADMMEDSMSPIPNVNAADQTSVTFLIEEEGDYGYYCNAHAAAEMAGAIYVRE